MDIKMNPLKANFFTLKVLSILGKISFCAPNTLWFCFFINRLLYFPVKG